MLTKVHGCCTYEEHAVAIAAFRSEGKYGERFCGVCSGPIQAGPQKCPHDCLIINGRSLCELCRAPHSDASEIHHVSQEQVDSFLRDMPAISDSELRAEQQQSGETESIADTNSMDGEEDFFKMLEEES